MNALWPVMWVISCVHLRSLLDEERRVGRRSVGGMGPHPVRRIAAVEQALLRRRPS